MLVERSPCRCMALAVCYIFSFSMCLAQILELARTLLGSFSVGFLDDCPIVGFIVHRTALLPERSANLDQVSSICNGGCFFLLQRQ